MKIESMNSSIEKTNDVEIKNAFRPMITRITKPLVQQAANVAAVAIGVSVSGTW